MPVPGGGAVFLALYMAACCAARSIRGGNRGRLVGGLMNDI